MHNIKLTLEYDGSRYFGFQRQKNQPTIQAALEEALSRLFNRPTKISAAAGRTDTGVHAAGQEVNFRIDSGLPPDKIQKGLNALLPKDMAVKKAEEMPQSFHARYDARSKTYEYRVLHSPVRSPLSNGRAYHYPYSLNLLRMKQAARYLVGSHDFKAFQAAGSSAGSSVRLIRRLEIRKEGALIRFEVEANGFLYHMVRSLVGTLLEIGRGRISPKELQKMMRQGDRKLAGPTLPACGLTLLEVRYSRSLGKAAPFRGLPRKKTGDRLPVR